MKWLFCYVFEKHLRLFSSVFINFRVISTLTSEFLIFLFCILNFELVSFNPFVRNLVKNIWRKRIKCDYVVFFLLFLTKIITEDVL